MRKIVASCFALVSVLQLFSNERSLVANRLCAKDRSHVELPARTANSCPKSPCDRGYDCDRSERWTNVYVGIEGGFNWTVNHSRDGYQANTDTGYGAGVVIGYQFPQGPGLEFETAYRNNTVDDVNYFGLLIPNGNHTWCLSWMGNIVYELPYWCWKPFVGAGIGFSLEHAETSSYNLPTDRNFDRFTYQALIGFDYNVWKGLDLGIEYKFLKVTSSYIDNHALMVDAKWYW